MKRETHKEKPRNRTRSTVPMSAKLQILTEAGYMCANPRCKHILTLELHHIEWVRDGGGNEPSNLIALCSNCHDLHTHGHIPREALDAWKQMLMLVNGSLDRESLDLLLFMHKFEKKSLDIQRPWREWQHKRAEERARLEANEDTTQGQLREHEQKWEAIEPPRGGEHPLRVTGDGLLRLVRLIRTGLVDEGDQDWESSDVLYMYYWEPVLTRTGRCLADAFLNGDARTFRELLAGENQPGGD